MNRLNLYTALAIALTLTGTGWNRVAAAPPNELLNGGFETDAVSGQDPIPGATDWTHQGTGDTNTASSPNDPVRTGVGSLQISSIAGGFGVPLMVRTFPASPGQRWDLQGYMLTETALPSNATFAILKIVFDDGAADLQIPASSVVVGEADAPAFPGIIALPRLNSTSTVNTWQFSHAAGIAPAGTVNVRLFALLVDESPSTVFFDDLQALLGGDFDADLDIDSNDLTIWKGASPATNTADADGDGDSDGADFLIWQRAFNPGAAVAAAVPEPCTALLLTAGFALTLGRRAKRPSCR